MKTMVVFFLLVMALAAQTTTINATTPVIDRQGNLLTGSFCVGATLFNATTPCQNISAGVMASYTVANGTYAIWINSGVTPIFTITGVVLNGTTINSGNYLSGQFAVLVGASSYVFPAVNNTTLATSCNGNAVALMGNPAANQEVQIQNLSGTTACTITGNGNVIEYQGASASPQSLAAHNSWIGIYVLNYDQMGLGHNAWLVSHLGS